MKSVSAIKLRQDLKACTDEVQQTGEPTVLLVHGRKTVGIVTVEGAEILEQIAQFDNCELAPDSVRAELKKLLQLALLEVTDSSEPSLLKIVKKLAADATTIQKYLGLCRSMNKPET